MRLHFYKNKVFPFQPTQTARLTPNLWASHLGESESVELALQMVRAAWGCLDPFSVYEKVPVCVCVHVCACTHMRANI